MKIGDLIKVRDCCRDEFLCDCFFCSTKSNRIGLVTSPAPHDGWHVMFDVGMWCLDKHDEAQGDVEVIRESR